MPPRIDISDFARRTVHANTYSIALARARVREHTLRRRYIGRYVLRNATRRWRDAPRRASSRRRRGQPALGAIIVMGLQTRRDAQRVVAADAFKRHDGDSFVAAVRLSQLRRRDTSPLLLRETDTGVEDRTGRATRPRHETPNSSHRVLFSRGAIVTSA